MPVAELTHIFRQAAGSMIVRGAHEVRRGEPPSFEAGEDLRRDLFLIERADPRAALDEIVSLVTKRLPEHYGVDPLTDIQVFAPVYKGALGIDAHQHAAAPRAELARRAGARRPPADRRQADALRPQPARARADERHVLRLLDHRDEKLMVSADGLIVELPDEEAPRLQLAYACSIHKGQGIELPVAIVDRPSGRRPVLPAPRDALHGDDPRADGDAVVGMRQVVARAAATPDTSRRYSRLAVRLAAG